MISLALGGFVALFLLVILRIPVGIAMGIVGVAGFGIVVGPTPAMSLLAQVPIRTATDISFSVVPMFILMGAFISASGMSKDLFRAAYAFLGHLRGGLGLATIASCAGFSSISGSAVATAATFSQVAYPEMRKYGYPKGFSVGTIAAGGTLGVMIPPSTIMIVYALITDMEIAKLFMAGIIPGILGMFLYMAAVSLTGRSRSMQLARGERSSWSERFASLGRVWPVLLLFVCIMVGIYGGVFTINEAAGFGAVGAFVIALALGRLSFSSIVEALVETVRTTASIFTTLIGAILFGYFLAITQVPQNVAHYLGELSLNTNLILIIILVGYLALGALMDEMALLILTLPVIAPVITALGVDPYWFAILLITTLEVGLIAPPVGMNIFVIVAVLKGEVSLREAYSGVAPFIIADVVRLALIFAFPVIAIGLIMS